MNDLNGCSHTKAQRHEENQDKKPEDFGVNHKDVVFDFLCAFVASCDIWGLRFAQEGIND
jgi:hypothetical protein